MGHTILVTGASGYLGSAVCADLAQDHQVIGIYRRMPTPEQRNATPSARWEKGDISDAECVDAIFRKYTGRGQSVSHVIHFAAYYHFGKNWRAEYYNTNIRGTRNIIEAAHRAGVKRLIFAGSITGLDPLPAGQMLTEASPAGAGIAYSRSKAMGEWLLARYADRVPVVILRLGGVFSDWCELPPLYSVMRMWSQPFLTGRMVVGKGRSGFPYIHRHDVVRIVRRIIEKEDGLRHFESFFASQQGCTCHQDLFPVIRRLCGRSAEPVFVPPAFARLALYGKYGLNRVLRKKTYERTWMIDYVDRPLVVDTAYTRRRLDWTPTPRLEILARLPVLMHNFKNHRRTWEARNIRRNDRQYEYAPDDGV
ncbi:NAD(P)-dependent oxidoreductase [Desulfonema ishimotonii]|uniref:NAD(P)-dependent oxidoreductase n=1 Tax=Desulfonema ishimotonii TaxID=45657 RepID=A0A401FWY0_9BACT|nr:NAD(P)-dependent oxidoreductase [Desulfonema ishimotonii]GBC61487.1 NAD(P)-dependent oxidoreductase [Desulfonema ishimotonii]